MKLLHLCTGLLIAQVSFAQASNSQAANSQAAEPQTRPVFEEVLITAQKREQAKREVPIALTAYSGGLLESLAIDDFTDLAATTAGVTVQSQSASTPTVVIRGISSDEGAAQDAPRVSIYLNDVDVSRNRGSMFELHDLQAVEVIKGPQASLFGTAASVGAIHVRTKRPEAGRSSELVYGRGNYGFQELRGYLNRGDGHINGRVAFNIYERDGYVVNLSDQDDLMAVDRISLRPSLDIQLSQQLQLNLTYSYERNDDSGVAYKSGLYRPSGGDTQAHTPAELPGSPNARNVFASSELGIDRTTKDFNAQLHWQIRDDLNLTWISGLRRFDVYELADADGSAAWALEVAEDTAGDQLSQEVRLHWQTDRQNWVFGLGYFQEDSFQRVVSNADEGSFLLCMPAARSALALIDPTGALGLGSVPCQNADDSFNSLTPILTSLVLPLSFDSLSYTSSLTTHGDNEAFSAYADGTIELSQSLDLHLGVRLIKEDRTSGFDSEVPNSLLLGVPLALIADTGGQRIEAGRSDTDVLPRIALNYSWSETSVYLSWSEGRKSALTQVTALLDANFQPLPPVSQIPAEEVSSLELGIQGQWPSINLDYSAAFFHQSYDNFQIDLINDAGVFVVANAGEASNNGFELETHWQPLDGLGVRASLAQIDAEIDRGSFQGQRFRLQPETSYSVSVLYEHALNQNLRLYGSATYAYQSEVFFDDAFQPVEPRSGLSLNQSGYGTLKASLGIENERGFALEIWGENLTDETFLIDAGNGAVGFGAPTYIAGAPRMLGVRFKLGWQL